MTFEIGSLVRARGREWVVLPDSVDDYLRLRPLGGTDAEITGLAPGLERVEPATFAPPTAADLGDHATARLLHEALRLTVRSSAGPFRSFGRIAVEPRPYQLVPLLMALRQETIRLLIADDVGVGKTVEAALIAREMLDRGEVSRLSVLCPPHLAEQWHAELRDKFHLDATLVLASTAARLERGLPYGVSLFERHDITIVSTDYIKSDRRREDFVRAAPELVIVDEAHTCADAHAERGGRHQRNRLVRGLANEPERHMILVTATPHSGSTSAFRELISLLDERFRQLSDDMTTKDQQDERRRLAQYLVQRRRRDIRRYLDADTPFPERKSEEITYRLSPRYHDFFLKVLKFARETVRDPGDGSKRQQRVRWWSALALLRTIGSSPAAAAATLSSRAGPADAISVKEADDIGARTVLDDTDESAEGEDVTPGSDLDDATDAAASSYRRKLKELEKDARTLAGADDEKLQGGIRIVRRLLEEGRRPIVFCRFIATADYVKEHLEKALGKDVTAWAITGTIPSDEREARVAELAEKVESGGQVVLVATDCLSEGVNLQETFDAVLHYDLSWNPTRHEQREGRVDRFLQPNKTVAVVTYYGENNPIDGLVLRVLLRKHREIKDVLGISVPIPSDANAVQEALLEALLLNETADDVAMEQLALFADQFLPSKARIHGEWERAGEREKQSQTIFAQATIQPAEVAKELAAARAAIGRGVDVERFVNDVLTRQGADVRKRDGLATFDLTEVPDAVKDVSGLTGRKKLEARFELPRLEREEVLARTHPVVEGLATWVADTTLDSQVGPREKPSARCGVIRTRGVDAVTTALLVRARHDITARRTAPLLAEEVRVVAFTGSPDRATWLSEDQAESLLGLRPDGDVPQEDKARRITRVTDGFQSLEPHLIAQAHLWASQLAEAHQRVRHAVRRSGAPKVEPQLPLDVLGIYVFLPQGAD